MEVDAFLEQLALAAAYYIALVFLIRLAGKRLAGQTTTFDLLVLISLGVTLQKLTLNDGRPAAAIFIVVVFGLHVGCARLGVRYAWIRRFLREEPRAVVRDGKMIQKALRDEGLTEEEVLAALRKLGFASADGLKIAVLEETGHISAIPEDDGKSKGDASSQTIPRRSK